MDHTVDPQIFSHIRVVMGMVIGGVLESAWWFNAS